MYVMEKLNMTTKTIEDIPICPECKTSNLAIEVGMKGIWCRICAKEFSIDDILWETRYERVYH